MNRCASAIWILFPAATSSHLPVLDISSISVDDQAAAAGLHMSDSHDPNVSQARVHECVVWGAYISSSGAQTYGRGRMEGVGS